MRPSFSVRQLALVDQLELLLVGAKEVKHPALVEAKNALALRYHKLLFRPLLAHCLFETLMNVDIYLDENLTALPGIYCAHCGKTITDASNANLIFKESYAKRSPVEGWDSHRPCTVYPTSLYLE